MKKLFVVFYLLLATSVFAQDIYIKTKTHSDAISVQGQNQLANDTFSEQWISKDKIASISKNQISIMDFQKNLAWIINPQDKTYIETTLPLDMSKLLPPEMAQMADMMKVTNVKVTPTGKKKTIGTRLCNEYKISLTMAMTAIDMSVYTTTNVPFDLKQYMAKIQPQILSSQFTGIDQASLNEMKKINGFQIATDTTINIIQAGVKTHSTSEVIEIAKKPAPAKVFSIPAGYTKQTSLSMQQLQGR